MKIFRSLASQLGFARDRAREPVFGLTKEQIASLHELRASDGWRTFAELLDISVSLYGEALLAARDDASMREARGMILGLRKAAHLVDETLRQAEESDRHSRIDRDREQRTRDASTVALWGSPAFGRVAHK